MRYSAIVAVLALSGCAVTPQQWDKAARDWQSYQASQPRMQPIQLEPDNAYPGFLVNTYVSGMNRICIYNRNGSQNVLTVSSGTPCPR